MPLSYSPIDFFKEYQDSVPVTQVSDLVPQTPDPAPQMTNDQLVQLMIEQNFLLRILILIGVFFVVIKLFER